jgi:RNA polymerase sigma-70 factor, ECF subfamily
MSDEINLDRHRPLGTAVVNKTSKSAARITDASSELGGNRDGEKNSEPAHTFDATILPHRTSLYRAALRLTRNQAEAEDLVQKTLVRALTRWHTFRNEPGQLSADGSPARAWVHTILRNLFIREFHHQKQKRGRDVSLSEFCEEYGFMSREISLSSVRATATPERVTIVKEEFIAIQRAMNRLPKYYGAILTMVVEEGLPYSEVAVRLNLPLGTVRSRLHRARKPLQRAVSAWQIGAL